VICVSHEVARVCRQDGIPTRKLRVVNDGADPARVRSGDRQRGRRNLGISQRQFLLLTVAKLTDHKGHRFLLRALPKVLPWHPEICLALVGDGKLSAKLKAEARQLGIDRHVRFLGYRRDVPDLIQASDLFVFPSQMEGLGSTLIDAMLARRAIVTTTAGGIPDLTASDQRGAEPLAWSVPPRDPQALADAILDAIASPETRALFQQRARQRAEQWFTVDPMIESTLCVYRELLDLRRGR
jgi:glycosyltransferase involved in cell wall biosynthesis